MLSEQKMKNIIKQKSKELGLLPQQLYSLYGLEELLKKVAASDYKDHFILKGGFLLASMYGLENRSTVDLDTTIKNFKVNRESIEELARYLEEPYPDGQAHFKVLKIKEIREEFEYDGFNLKIDFMNGNARIPIDLDITTGEKLLPTPIRKVPLLFSDGSIDLPTYPLEQVLADKVYTTLAYGQQDDTNTRAKDLYDIYYIATFQEGLDFNQVNQAIEAAKKQRNIQLNAHDAFKIAQSLAESTRQKQLWKNYQQDHVYAKDITFQDVFSAVKQTIMSIYPELLVKKEIENEFEF